LQLGPSAVEAIDRCPNHISTASTKDDRQFVSKRRLPRRVWPVDRDTRRMVRIERIDQTGEAEDKTSAVTLFTGGHSTESRTERLTLPRGNRDMRQCPAMSPNGVQACPHRTR
jgi:hypothetical protein